MSPVDRRAAQIESIASTFGDEACRIVAAAAAELDVYPEHALELVRVLDPAFRAAVERHVEARRAHLVERRAAREREHAAEERALRRRNLQARIRVANNELEQLSRREIMRSQMRMPAHEAATVARASDKGRALLARIADAERELAAEKATP